MVCILGGLPTRGRGSSHWGSLSWGSLSGVPGRRPSHPYWQPLQQSACILLECILVLKNFFSEMTNPERFQGHNSYSVMICSDNFDL